MAPLEVLDFILSFQYFTWGIYYINEGKNMFDFSFIQVNMEAGGIAVIGTVPT